MSQTVKCRIDELYSETTTQPANVVAEHTGKPLPL